MAGWDIENDHFGTPLYNTAPVAFYARNLFKVITSEQDRCFASWNDKWSASESYTLKRFEANEMQIGRPLSNASRGLYAIIYRDPVEQDNYMDEKITLNLVCLSGNVQL